jgi:hypothetical protein
MQHTVPYGCNRHGVLRSAAGWGFD